MSRYNVSMTESVEDRANAIIQARGFNGLSDLLATLVREDFERRNLALPENLELKEAPITYGNKPNPLPKSFEREIAKARSKAPKPKGS